MPEFEKADEFGGRHHARDAFGHGQFTLGRECKHTADFHAIPRGFIDPRIRVAEDRGTVAQAVVDVLVVVDVGHARAAAMLDVDGRSPPQKRKFEATPSGRRLTARWK